MIVAFFISFSHSNMILSVRGRRNTLFNIIFLKSLFVKNEKKCISKSLQEIFAPITSFFLFFSVVNLQPSLHILAFYLASKSLWEPLL